MPESWKTIPINAGLLIALVAGVAATVLSTYGLQLWVDSRAYAAVERQLSPIDHRLGALEGNVGQLRRSHETLDREVKILGQGQEERHEELLEALRSD